jgi:hypothetical protein
MLALSSSQSLTYTAPIHSLQWPGSAHNVEFSSTATGHTVAFPTPHEISSSYMFLDDQMSCYEFEDVLNEIHPNQSPLMEVDGLSQSSGFRESADFDANNFVSPILSLPDEVLVMIFNYLDPRSFCRVAGVCSHWRRLAASPWLWWMRCNVLWEHILYICRRNARICDEILSNHLEKKFSTKVKLLLETLNDLKDRSVLRVKSCSKAHYNIDCYYTMTNVLLSHLYESNGIISRIRDNPDLMTVNFDILDLSIRRYIDQLDYMFPASSSFRPAADSCFLAPTCVEEASSIIKDENARGVWNKYVGKNIHSVDFSWFYERVLLVRFPLIQCDDVFRDFFSFFVNFPRDNMMTTYKWTVIIDQFGPFDEFPSNFKKYGCGFGFLGLMNCVEAEEHLTAPNMFLLRFSRKEPEKLTFSFKIMNGAHGVVCRHKRKPCGVPISLFINQHFNPRRFFPVEKRLEDHATQLDNLEQYCESSGYFIAAHP